MRKPITIRKEDCGFIWNSLLEIAHEVQFHNKLTIYPHSRIVGLKLVVSKLTKRFIEESELATKELGIEPDEKELLCIEYLKSLVL